jgi:hypothetical protein
MDGEFILRRGVLPVGVCGAPGGVELDSTCSACISGTVLPLERIEGGVLCLLWTRYSNNRCPFEDEFRSHV